MLTELKCKGLRDAAAGKAELWRIVADPQWAHRSQRQIAAHLGVGKSWVAECLEKYRAATGNDGPRAAPSPGTQCAKKRAPLPHPVAPPKSYLLVGDARRVLGALPDDHFGTCVTSPPF